MPKESEKKMVDFVDTQGKKHRLESVDINDPRLKEYLAGRADHPDGLQIRSPYGEAAVDVGTGDAVSVGGAATGDDGNTGSSRG